MEIHTLVRFSTFVFGAFAVVRAQYNHHQYSSYYNQQHHQNQPANSDYSSGYQHQYKYGQSQSQLDAAAAKTSHYPYHYDSAPATENSQQTSNYLYHNLTGYPYHGNPTQAPQPSQNDVNVDYYDYYNYEYETEAPSALSKSDVLISPHPFLVSVQRWLKGLDLQTARFDLGLLSGNTVYLVISIVLGVIGVGGLLFQWGSGIIDEFFSTFDDLKARLDALEGATTTGTATTACTCDLTAVTATANAACAKLAEITDLAYVDTGDMALDADTYGKALDALTTDTCT